MKKFRVGQTVKVVSGGFGLEGETVRVEKHMLRHDTIPMCQNEALACSM